MTVKRTRVLRQAGRVCTLVSTLVLLSACHDSSTPAESPQPPPPPPPTSASVTPGVNPAFDSVTEVASSNSAGGTYTADSDVNYDSATETVTLVAGAVPADGHYVRIIGTATIGGVTSSYTIYTFVGSNTAAVAANELTSLAVGHVADGTAATFDAAVDQIVAASMGISAEDIVASTMAADRGLAMTASMTAISNLFENGGFVPGVSNAGESTAAIGQCIASGGLAWDNMSQIDAGGTGVLPAAEPNKDYQRCKACHGWDQLGTDGGYARRSRKETRPNAGYEDPNTVSRNISTGFGGHSPITIDMVLHAGTGRSWGDGSAVYDDADPWGPGAQKGNEHPDLSASGINNPDVPSNEQIRCLTAFLNYPEARANQVFSMVKPNSDPASAVPSWCASGQCTEYMIVSTADAARGDAWYHDPAGGNCVTCHGEPTDEMGPIAPGPEGGLQAFLQSDGKYSEFRHKVQWGQAGDDLMTRANMNNPTAADIADVLAYLQVGLEVDVGMAEIELGGLAWDNMSKIDAGGTDLLPAAEPNKDYQRCKACHGWDQLGTDGGYARRSRKDTRPNAGFEDPNTVSRNVSNDAVFGNAGAISEAMVLHAGSGRSWAEGSAAFDSASMPWGEGAQKGNEHPDLSMGGVNGTDVPSAAQIAGLVAFLNYPDARIDAVFSAIDPNPETVPAWCVSDQCTDYTVVSTADAALGEAWYMNPNGGNCVTCHGQPEDAMGPIAPGPEGGLLAFLRADGKFSEFRHKAQWGEAGDDLMTRANMGNPTGADVANVLAFLKGRIDGLVGGFPVANDDTATTTQNTPVDIDVLANDSDPTNGVLTISEYDALTANDGTVDCLGTGICSYTPATSFTGTDTFTYAVDNGTEPMTATVTVTVSSPSGDAAAGQARFEAECGVCHSAGGFDMTVALGGNEIGGRGAELVGEGKMLNNMEETDSAMANITLTDQEILDMVAFLDSL
jgi:mono/diheme cytochrome c family protein